MRISPPLLAALLALAPSPPRAQGAPSQALAQGAPAPIRLPKGSTGPADGLTVSGRPLSSIIDATGGKTILKPDAITGDGSGLSFTARGITATVDRLLSTRTPRAWGADPALPDNAAAIKSALESGIPIVLDAIYPVTTPITVNGCPAVRGGNPAIHGLLWTTTGGGLTINCSTSGHDTSKSGLNLRDFGIYTTATSGGGSPLTVNFGAQLPGRIIHPNGLISGMRFAGRDINIQNWSGPVNIKNAQGLTISDNFVSGRFGSYNDQPSTGTTGGFRLFNDPGTPSHANILQRNKISAVDKTIILESHGKLGVEGTSILDNVLVGDHWGVYIDNTDASYAPPYTLITGNQFEVSHKAIYATNAAQIYIDGNGLYIDGSGGTCGSFKDSNTVFIGPKNFCLTVGPHRGTTAWEFKNTPIGTFGGGAAQYFTTALTFDKTSTDWTVYPFFSINTPTSVIDQTNNNLVLGANGSSLTVPGLNILGGGRLIEMGSTSAASNTGVDFHTSGSPNDYDSRILARGGKPGTSGAGILSLISGILEIAGTMDFGGATAYFDGVAQAFVWKIGGTEVGRLDSGAWTDWTPTVSCGSGAPTNTTATGRYRKTGKTVTFNLKVNITTSGTCGLYVDASLPIAARTAGIGQYPGAGYAEGSSADSLRVAAFASTVRMTRYNNQFVGGDGTGLYASGTYELP